MGPHLSRSQSGLIPVESNSAGSTHSKMDITTASGAVGPGSIPGGCIFSQENNLALTSTLDLARGRRSGPSKRLQSSAKEHEELDDNDC